MNTILSQCNNNIKIISPVSKKPTEPVVSFTCSTFTVKWKGQSDQSFIVKLVEKTQEHKIMDTITTTNYSFDGIFYSTTFNVQQNSLAYWTIEATALRNNIRYYSYGLKGMNPVPVCAAIAVAKDGEKANALSIISGEKMLVSIYPNPVQSTLNIEFNGKSTLKKTISIYDVNGKLLVAKSSASDTRIDVKQLTAGTYLIKITDESDKELYNGKLIKQ